jgi:hypothetical protein
VVLQNHSPEETGHDRHPFISPTLLVVIDISKYRHEVPIRIAGQTRSRRRTVMNALEDFLPVRGPRQLRPWHAICRWVEHPPHHFTPSSGFRLWRI